MLKTLDYQAATFEETIKENVVWGHHVYENVWRPSIGEQLPVFFETDLMTEWFGSCLPTALCTLQEEGMR